MCSWWDCLFTGDGFILRQAGRNVGFCCSGYVNAFAFSCMTAPNATIAAQTDPKDWVELYGDYLYRFAMTRVRDPALAEDMVQETFLAALRKRTSFAGRSSERSWLASILKNKVYDHFRKHSRVTNYSEEAFFEKEEKDLFTHDGEWPGGWKPESVPLDWSEKPGRGLDREEFWRAFHHCTSLLPRNVAQVFQMREVDELETDTICETLNITPNNLWVILHRARLAMRKCLEENWVRRDEKSSN